MPGFLNKIVNQNNLPFIILIILLETSGFYSKIIYLKYINIKLTQIKSTYQN